MMEPIVAPLERRLAQISAWHRRSGRTSRASPAPGSPPQEATSPAYWARHARETGALRRGARHAAASARRILLEVGPGNVLSTLALQGLQGRDIPVVTSLQDAARESSDHERLLEALGRLWLHGA